MVDAAQPERISEAKSELEQLLKMKELRQVPIVVLGNKIDKASALKEDEFRKFIGLPYFATYGKETVPRASSVIRPIEVFMCSVKARVGYQDAFAWLAKFITNDQEY